MPESDGEVLNPNFRLSSFIRARHGPDEAIELPEPRPTPVDGYVYKAAVAKLGTLDSTDHHIVGCPVNAEVPVQLLHMCMYVCVYIYTCVHTDTYTHIFGQYIHAQTYMLKTKFANVRKEGNAGEPSITTVVIQALKIFMATLVSSTTMAVRLLLLLPLLKSTDHLRRCSRSGT